MTDLPQLGPKMRLLNERQRAFVVAYIEHGSQNYGQAYSAAGYAVTNDNSRDAAASRLAHSPKIQSAILEETGNRLHALAPVALRRVLEIAMNKDHKDSFAAAKHILSATGFNSKQTIDVNHAGTVDVSWSELQGMLERINRAGLPPPMIDITPVKDD